AHRPRADCLRRVARCRRRLAGHARLPRRPQLCSCAAGRDLPSGLGDVPGRSARTGGNGGVARRKRVRAPSGKKGPAEMTMQDTHQYLDPIALAKVRNLEMQARLIVEGYLSGMHKSPYHGFSVEFAQHREYVPGDDLKHLDWKVYSRTGRFYLK